MNMTILTKKAVLFRALKLALPNACIQPTATTAFSNITSASCFSTAAYH